MWRLVRRRALKCQPPTRLVGYHHPTFILSIGLPAEHLRVEGSKLVGIPAVGRGLRRRNYTVNDQGAGRDRGQLLGRRRLPTCLAQVAYGVALAACCGLGRHRPVLSMLLLRPV